MWYLENLGLIKGLVKQLSAIRTNMSDCAARCTSIQGFLTFKNWYTSIVHFQEKQYKCGTCSKSFVHKKDLVVHIKAQHGPASFKCEECGQTYGYKNSLKRHVAAQHKRDLSICRVCLTTFKFRDNYVRHCKRFKH
jgi:uncharacterized Zn-finger protein